MSTLTIRAERDAAYRARLCRLLQIPEQPDDQTIHKLIEAGFPAVTLQALVDTCALSREACKLILSSRMLRLRVLRLQCLTASESDRLYRIAHVTAVAEEVFGNRQKAYRWLNKPKKRLLGSSPVGLLSTLIGGRIVEDMLMQMSEGLAL